MKKTIRYTKWIFILLICISFFAIWIYAERPVILVFTEEIVENNELYETIKEQIGALDLRDLQEYLHSLNAFSDQTVGERLIEYITRYVSGRVCGKDRLRCENMKERPTEISVERLLGVFGDNLWSCVAYLYLVGLPALPRTRRSH